jgi:hypothetical protein
MPKSVNFMAKYGNHQISRNHAAKHSSLERPFLNPCITHP